MSPRHGHAAPLAFWPARDPFALSLSKGEASPEGFDKLSPNGLQASVPPDTGAAPRPSAAALVLPALGVPAGAYRRLAEALAALGIATGVAEWRGGGTSPVRAARGVDWGYLELFEHEVLGGLAALRQRLPGRPIVIVGHSLGGHLGLMARAAAKSTEDSGLAGVLTIASGTPTTRFFSPRLRMQIGVVLAAHRIGGPLLGYFPGHRIGFGGRQSRTLMDEWALLARLGRFEVGGRNLLEPASEAARRIPVQALSMPRDTYAPHAATAHLLALAGVGEAHIERFEGPGPLGHFDWLKEPQAVAARMDKVLRRWVAADKVAAS